MRIIEFIKTESGHLGTAVLAGLIILLLSILTSIIGCAIFGDKYGFAYAIVSMTIYNIAIIYHLMTKYRKDWAFRKDGIDIEE